MPGVKQTFSPSKMAPITFTLSEKEGSREKAHHQQSKLEANGATLLLDVSVRSAGEILNHQRLLFHTSTTKSPFLGNWNKA